LSKQKKQGEGSPPLQRHDTRSTPSGPSTATVEMPLTSTLMFAGACVASTVVVMPRAWTAAARNDPST
jgi:hypothetical protein